MAFPPAAYTARGGVGTVSAYAKVEAARTIDPEPQPPATPGAAILPEDEQRLAA